MDLASFTGQTSGILVPISGTDPRFGEWAHRAFVPNPLPDETPRLSSKTHLQIANARAALAALDSTAMQLENPTLLRQPTLRREAQSTSALEGTYAPLSDVLIADEDNPADVNMREILNYILMAEHAYGSVLDGRSLSVGFLSELQQLLVRGTPAEAVESGHLRSIQVVIGQRRNAPVEMAPVFRSRFVPSPPGADLEGRLADLLGWMSRDHRATIDPVAASGMGHYQFETLHPFHDGNGRIGRLLISVQLLTSGVLSEPTLSVSPWFEARREEYYDRLFEVSAASDWDTWLEFYATGIEESAIQTRRQMLRLVDVAKTLHGLINASNLRANTAHNLADFAVAHPSFTVRQVERGLNVSYGRANKLTDQLVDLGILEVAPSSSFTRRFFAPAVLNVLTT